MTGQQNINNVDNPENKNKEVNKKNNNKTEKTYKKEVDHSGHRRRVRERYRRNGFDAFEFHEILDLILFYSIPRADTYNIARDLQKKFGKSLANILEADEHELAEIEGISEQTALFFRLLVDITRKYNIETLTKSYDIKNITEYKDFLIAHYTGVPVETLVLITLNNRMQPISDEIIDVIYVGDVNSSKVDVNKMVKIALNRNAANIIIAHNHPGGSAIPSIEDIETTKRIRRIFNEINIRFVDHYVVAGTKIYSMEEKLIHDYLK